MGLVIMCHHEVKKKKIGQLSRIILCFGEKKRGIELMWYVQ